MVMFPVLKYLLVYDSVFLASVLLDSDVFIRPILLNKWWNKSILSRAFRLANKIPVVDVFSITDFLLILRK